ncbi:hypothetical protein [Photobacterium ganghwense]|uniref:hypothetical protein n=1 Tax=Photobacterium ganghwense TaxID=320778 RepID=UPI001C2D86C4|nr:hypothetical protein [Photobacterium ganghwense]MBV1839662.1 hypothetical protein [Photobacterium ganghwense]
MKLRQHGILLAMLAALAGCGEPDLADKAKAPEAEQPVAVEEPVKLPAEVDIWQSPTELDLEGTKVTLHSALWLNTMPVIGEDGSVPANKLFASIKVVTADDKPLPKGVEIMQVMMAQDDEQWLSQNNLDVRVLEKQGLEIAINGGPEWLPGGKANIAVTLLYKGQEHVLVETGVLLEQAH